MKKLAYEDMTFEEVNPAENNGEQPRIIFYIKNLAAVEAFLRDTAGTRIWGGVNQTQTARLGYTLDLESDPKTLTVYRSVKGGTMALAANQSLALAVKELIYDDDPGVIDDFYIPLTGKSSRSSERVVGTDLIEQIKNELYPEAPEADAAAARGMRK